MSYQKFYNKCAQNRLLRRKKQNKKLKSLKMNFYHQCVAVVKRCSGGYIHPADTSWEALAFAFEYLLQLPHVPNAAYKRCLELAPLILGKEVSLPHTLKGRFKHNNPQEKHEFYNSFQWKKLRYATLKKYGARCQCCGAGRSNNIQLHVDHIKPISKYWELRLDPKNVQVLCSDCNWGKLNIDETDWR